MARGDRDHRDDGCGGLALMILASLAVLVVAVRRRP